MEKDWRNAPVSVLTVTEGAKGVIGAEDILDSLERHSRLEWGDLPKTYATQNEWVLEREQGTLLSAFRSKKGIEFYVWTYLLGGRALETVVVLRDDYWS